MRHKNSGRRLGRKSPHRRAMYRNLAASLLVHETVRTTLPKAKELRRVVEPLITLAKEDGVSRRRLAFDRLRDDAAVGRLVQGARPALQEPAGRLPADPEDGLPRRRLRADGDRAAARSAREGRRAQGTAHDGVSRVRPLRNEARRPEGRRAFFRCSAVLSLVPVNSADEPADPCLPSPHRLESLASPAFIASLALLVINDAALKPLLHNAFTGKLSDFAGLFALTLFAATLWPRQRRLVGAAIAAAFASGRPVMPGR